MLHILPETPPGTPGPFGEPRAGTVVRRVLNRFVCRIEAAANPLSALAARSALTPMYSGLIVGRSQEVYRPRHRLFVLCESRRFRYKIQAIERGGAPSLAAPGTDNNIWPHRLRMRPVKMKNFRRYRTSCCREATSAAAMEAAQFHVCGTSNIYIPGAPFAWCCGSSGHAYACD